MTDQYITEKTYALLELTPKNLWQPIAPNRSDREDLITVIKSLIDKGHHIRVKQDWTDIMVVKEKPIDYCKMSLKDSLMVTVERVQEHYTDIEIDIEKKGKRTFRVKVPAHTRMMLGDKLVGVE